MGWEATLLDVLKFVVKVLIEALFIHLAAAVAVQSPRFVKAFVVAIAANVVAFVSLLVLPSFQTFRFVVVLFALLSICATVYKTTWVRAVVISLLGYLLWVLTEWLLAVVPQPF